MVMHVDYEDKSTLKQKDGMGVVILMRMVLKVAKRDVWKSMV